MHVLPPASQSLRSSTIAAVFAAGRTTSKLGCGCSDCAKRQGLQQPKLEIGAPDDAHEREADQIADRVAAGAGENTVGVAPVRVQRSVGGTPCASKEGAAHGPADPTASVERALASPGAPLERTLRTDMERRFGHDFSRVRVHSGTEADRSARGLNAGAYTLGNDIVFSSGRFAPHTQAGRRLLAHELTHVVQQADEPRVVQRDMGFEFQTTNTVKSNKRKEFGRKFGGFLHKVPPSGKDGMEVQTDTGNVLEFETFHFQKWSDLKAQIQSAADIAAEIAKNPKAFPFNNVDALKKQGKLKKDEVLEVDIDDATFDARIQANEGIALTQVESLLNERVAPGKAAPSIIKAGSVLEDFNADTEKGTNRVLVDDLHGFMYLVMFYLVAAQQTLTSMDRASPVKARFTLLSKTKFSAMFNSILSKPERALFIQIVKSGAIPKELKRSGSDPVFPEGYWGHLGGSEDWVLFRGGKVVAVAPENHKDDVHDCSSKTQPPGVNTKNCGVKKPETVVSIDDWLNSIIAGGTDILSPPPHGSTSMGKREVDKTGTEKGLVLLESRDFRGMGFEQKHSAPASKWVKFAEDLFQVAAACRRRKGTGTELIYDGNRSAFDRKKCP